MWELIANALSSLFGGAGGEIAPAAAEIGGEAGGAGGGFGGLGGLGGLLGGAGQLAGGLLGRGDQQMPGPRFDQSPANLSGQQNPALLRQRALGSSADLQARGLNVGAAPDFLQKQLESELGLTPDEFQRIFRLGGAGTGGLGA